ncbi:ATP-grasp domain-containing protein [Streptomyces anulatus]
MKSRKHEWYEACYVPELADAEQLASVVGRFVEPQGTFLSGGLVPRSCEPFVAGGEARARRVVEVGDGQVSGGLAGAEDGVLFAAPAGAEPR